MKWEWSLEWRKILRRNWWEVHGLVIWKKIGDKKLAKRADRCPESGGEMEARKTEIAMADCIKSNLERVGEMIDRRIGDGWQRTQLRDCLQDVSLWMKKVKCKQDRIYHHWYRNAACKTRRLFPPTHILNQSVTPAPSVSNLGVNFDESFNFKQHMSKTCRCCFYHIRDLRRIRRLLSLSVVKPSRQL